MNTEMRNGELIFILTLAEMDHFTRNCYNAGYKEGYCDGEKDGKKNYIVEQQREINNQRRKKYETKG